MRKRKNVKKDESKDKLFEFRALYSCLKTPRARNYRLNRNYIHECPLDISRLYFSLTSATHHTLTVSNEKHHRILCLNERQTQKWSVKVSLKTIEEKDVDTE